MLIQEWVIQTKTKLSPYKWLLLPGIPLLIIILLTIIIFSENNQPTTQQQAPTRAPQQTNETQTTIPQGNTTEQVFEDHEDETPLEEQQNFIEKETLPNGTVKYSFTSENQARPDITIRTQTNESLFSREASERESPFGSVSVFQETYGPADKIISGTAFYGPQSAIYFYGDIGMAIIADPQTGNVYEQQLFTPMSSEEYLQRFGAEN